MATLKLRLAPQGTIFVLAVALAAALSATAQAADAAHAWGTISNPGAELLNSASTHEEESQTAQIGALGAGSGGSSSGFPAVTSCGTCTTITIQGNQNSISGTSITSSNQGVVTSNGAFDQ